MTPPLRLLELFLEMLSVERGVSANTIEAYSQDLRRLLKYLEEKKLSLLSVRPSDLRAYVRYLHEQKLSARSIQRHLSSTRQLYRFLLQTGYRQDDPTSLLDRPKATFLLPGVLSEEEVMSLLQQAQCDTSAEGVRLYVLLEILYASGLRVSELVTLQESCFVRGAETLIIKGKGDKERMVPLGSYALKALEAYHTVRSCFLKEGGSSKWMFPSPSAQGHLTRQRFGQLLKNLALKAGIDPSKVSPHVIRHAFATHLLDRGADLMTVQALLGHADIQTTQIYTHVLKGKLVSVMEKCHPLSKFAQDQK